MLGELALARTEESNDSLGELVRSVAKALVDDQASVAVSAWHDAHQTTILLFVAHGDLSNIIGKQGRTARSIRVVLQAATLRVGRGFSLDIRATKRE